MKHILGLVIIGFIVFTNCEGRINKTQALKHSIENFKETVSLNVDVFIPDSYMDKEIDTLLSNGFRIKIKTFTDMANSVTFSKIKDTINYQSHYRNFKIDVIVEKKGKTLFNKSYNKKKMNKALGFNKNLLEGSDLYNFSNLAVLKSIEVNDNPSLVNMVQIDFIYEIPNTAQKSYHRLIINDKGKANFVQLK